MSEVRAKYSKKDRFKSVRPEIDEDEVQKQIKETYARMTEGKGKTKGSRRRREKREIISQKAQEEQILQELPAISSKPEFVTANELAILMNNTLLQKGYRGLYEPRNDGFHQPARTQRHSYLWQRNSDMR